MIKAWLTPRTVFYLVVGIVVAVLAIKGLKYLDTVLGEKQRLYTELIGEREKYRQLSERAAQLEIQYQEQSDLRKEAEKRFSEEKEALKSQIKVLADATFLIKEKARESGNSDVVFDGPNSQFILNEVKFNDGPAVGYVLIFKDGRVVSKLYNHQIKVNTIVSKDEDTGRYSVVSKADYILKSPSLNLTGKNWLNVPYPLKIVGGTALIDPTEPVLLKKRFHFWNPKANLNVNLDPSGIYPGAGLSIFSYGYTKNDLDWRFVQIGFQTNNGKFQPTLTPLLWRPFNGVLSNTYIGPGLSYDQGLKYFLGVQVGL